MKIEKYKIQKGIPIPEKRANYPFNKMLVGDSFETKDNPDSARVAAHSYGTRTNMKFLCRRTPLGGIRIWRTK